MNAVTVCIISFLLAQLEISLPGNVEILKEGEGHKVVEINEPVRTPVLASNTSRGVDTGGFAGVFFSENYERLQKLVDKTVWQAVNDSERYDGRGQTNVSNASYIQQNEHLPESLHGKTEFTRLEMQSTPNGTAKHLGPAAENVKPVMQRISEYPRNLTEKNHDRTPAELRRSENRITSPVLFTGETIKPGEMMAELRDAPTSKRPRPRGSAKRKARKRTSRRRRRRTRSRSRRSKRTKTRQRERNSRLRKDPDELVKSRHYATWHVNPAQRSTRRSRRRMYHPRRMSRLHGAAFDQPFSLVGMARNMFNL